jgi:hypothetical protein
MKNDINLEHLQYSWRSNNYSLVIKQENYKYTGKLSKVPSIIKENIISEGLVSFSGKTHPMYEIIIDGYKYDCAISIISSANNFTPKNKLVEKITIKIEGEGDIEFLKD